MKKFRVGQSVLLTLMIGAIPAGTAGVVSEVVKEGCEGDYIVRVCGVDLTVIEGDLIEPVNASSDSGEGVVVGDAGKQSAGAGSSDGKSHETGIVDGGAVVGAGAYTIADAVGELANLAVQLDHDHDSVSSANLLEIVGKMQTIAA